jgi:RNA polymerase sigma-70 factor (ECF subfamily)
LRELAELTKQGDKSAFDEVIRKCVPDLFRIAMSILKNKDDADDVVCETVVKAYENIHKLKDCTFFKTWITRILINHAAAAYKRRKKVVCLSDVEYEPCYGVTFSTRTMRG